MFRATKIQVTSKQLLLLHEVFVWNHPYNNWKKSNSSSTKRIDKMCFISTNLGSIKNYLKRLLSFTITI